jgi:hypothetical protein
MLPRQAESRVLIVVANSSGVDLTGVLLQGFYKKKPNNAVPSPTDGNPSFSALPAKPGV